MTKEHSGQRPSSNNALLFAVMALRTGFINGDQLLAALHTWVDCKSETIDSVLIRLGFLSHPEALQLKPLVDAYISRQGGDSEKGLRQLSAIEDLDQLEIGDPDLENSLQHLKSIPTSSSPKSSPSEQEYDETKTLVNDTGRFRASQSKAVLR